MRWCWWEHVSLHFYLVRVRQKGHETLIEVVGLLLVFFRSDGIIRYLKISSILRFVFNLH